MVSFNPYTKPVSPGQTYLPLSDEVLLMGAKSAYDQKDKTAQKIGSTYNSLFGISTYGKDAEVLSQFQQDFENQVAELSKANLRDPEVTSKINSLITQYSSNPDVLNIHKRASFYNNELKKEQEAAEKGQKYRSPGRESIEKYYNSGVYYRNPENINYSSGWVSPDTTKAMQDAVKMSTKEIRDPKTGVVTKEAKPEDISKSFYEIMKNNPNYQRDLQYSFEKENEGVDWNNHGQEFIQNKANTLQQQFQDAVSLGDLETAQMIKNEYSRLQNLSDPSLIGDNLKQQYFQNYIQNQLDKVGYANDVSDFVKIERDPIELKLQDLSNQKAAKLYELQLKTGILPEKGESQTAYIQRLAQESQKKDLEIAQAKQDIKTEAQKELQQNAYNLKVQYLGEQGKFKAITNKGGDKINLGGETFDKSTILNSIGNDINTVQKILESNPSKFGLDCITCNGRIDNTHGLVDKGDHYEYQQDSLVPGGETTFTIRKDALQAYILDGNTDIDITYGRGNIIGGGEENKVDESKDSKENTNQNTYQWSNQPVPKTFEDYKQIFIKANNGIAPTKEQEQALKNKWNASK